MRKLFGIIICLILAIACIAPACVFAEETPSATAEEVIHFINPTALTVMGDYLYVADNIEEDKCAIICFEAAENTTAPKYTFELDKHVTNLSNNGNDIVYAICGSEVIELKITSGQMPVLNETHSFAEGTSIVDIAYGEQYVLSDKTMYALTANQMLYYSNANKNFSQFGGVSGLNDTKGCLINTENSTAYLYYLSDNGCARYNITTNGGDDEFSKRLTLTFTPNGIFSLDNLVAVYSDRSVYKIEESGSLSSNTLRYDAISLFAPSNEIYGADCSIVDVVSYGNKLFVLNSKNQIDIFGKTEDFYDTEPISTIGSDVVHNSLTAPFTSFTLVKSIGYPTNIVFKTNDETTSIPELIPDAEEYIVLGYEGDQASHYYYVLVGDKYGWVKKSDGAASADNDSKLAVVDTSVGGNLVGYVTKFNSLNGIFVNDLPRSDKTIAHTTEVTQTASSMKDVKLLQKFTEVNGDETVEWYYIEYENNQSETVRGFVQRHFIGNFHSSAKTEDIVPLGDKKINSSLFEAVKLYGSSDMSESDIVYDENDNMIKLYSGDRVTVIEEKDDASFIMILHSNGARDFGWVETSRLIGIHSITTNAIVGLSLLGFAIVLVAILLLVYFKRKKKIKANKD